MKTKITIVLLFLLGLQSFAQVIGSTFQFGIATTTGRLTYKVLSSTTTITGARVGTVEVFSVPNILFQSNSMAIPTSVTNTISNVTTTYSVVGIGNSAFASRTTLEAISIPTSVASIGTSAFSGCTRLTRIILPNTLTTLSASIFEGCTALRIVTIPRTVSNIGNRAFSGCRALQSIVIPNSVATIGDGAFYQAGLTTVAFPSSVTSIGASAFYFCQNLLSVSIPSSVASIGDNAFAFCTRLNTVRVNWANPLVVNTNVFDWVSVAAVDLEVPFVNAGTPSPYYTALVWQNFRRLTTNRPVAPVAAAQTFCNSNPRVSNLVATGTNLSWYTTAVGGASLASTTALTSGTYYVLQTVNGLESTRTAVTVTVNNTPAPVAADQTLIEGATLNNLVATGTNLQWYAVQTGGTALSTTTVFTAPSNYTYYVSQTINGCESPRIAVEVTILSEYTDIPDRQFELALIALGIDTDGENRQILTASARAQRFLDLTDRTAAPRITDMTGIEAFVNLIGLNCSRHSITSLDVTALSSLRFLDCSFNQLTNLQVSGLAELDGLDCSNNQLMGLDLTGLFDINIVNCSNNRLTRLDATMFDLESSDPRIELDCSNNLLTRLELGISPLTKLICNNNNLTNIDFIGAQHHNLKVFNCASNNFINMDLRPFNPSNPLRPYELDSFDATSNPNLNCISVRDANNVRAAYLADAHVSWSNNCFAPMVINLCQNSIAVPLTSPFGANAILNWYTAAGSAITITPPNNSPTPITNRVGSTVYYVSQSSGTIAGSIESDRIAVTVNVAASVAPSRITAFNTRLNASTTTFAAGSTTIYRLTATPVLNASSYLWELPAGCNLVPGPDAPTIDTNGDLTGPNNFIDVNFSGVTAANTASVLNNQSIPSLVLFIGVKSKIGDCYSTTNNGITTPPTSSTARLLVLSSPVPRNPGGIVVTPGLSGPRDGKIKANSRTAADVKPITDISTYIGTPQILTARVAEVANANEYIWELPKGAKQLSGGKTNEITLDFAAVPEGTTSLYLGVKAANGAGESVTSNKSLVPATTSTARLLRLTASVPAIVTAVTGQIVGLCSNTIYSYTITSSPLARFYTITAPTGAVVQSATIMSNTSNMLTTPDLVFTVHYPIGFVATPASLQTLSVIAQNRVGSSLPRIITLSTLMPAIGTITGSHGIANFSRSRTQTFTAPVVLRSLTYNWTVDNGARIVSPPGISTITVDFSAVPTTTSTVKVSVVAKNDCGVSTAIKSFVLRSLSERNAAIETLTVDATEVYPNPVSSVFNVDVTASKAGNLVMAIYSLEGVVVMNSKTISLNEGANTISENVSSLVKGVYVLQLINSSNNEVITKKLIKN